MDELKPETTYYYTVGSMEANGNNDGVKSSLSYLYGAGLKLRLFLNGDSRIVVINLPWRLRDK